MAIRKQVIGYEVDGLSFEGLAVWDDAVAAPRPGVLVAPTFMDRSAFEDGKAEALAALGYTGFALDIFGVDVRPQTTDEAMTAMSALNGDRPALARRMAAALAALRGVEGVDSARVAAIGFCFGGKCVLDLARSGADICGVASFHGIFDAPTEGPAAGAGPIGARVLALHGWDDTLADPQAVLAFAAEMTARAASWELDAYGHTGHGFTAQHRPAMYREEADRRSWARLTDFLAELF